MSKLDFSCAPVLYPRYEHATAYATQDSIPFSSSMIGVTLPYPNYRMSRSEGHHVNIFEYVEEGEGEIFVGGVWHRAVAGDCYVLVAGEPHEYRSSQKNPMKKLWINYTADYIPPMLTAYKITSGVYRAPDAHRHFKRLIDIAESTEPSDELHFSIAECVHGTIHEIARSATIKVYNDEYGIKRALAARVYTKLNLDELSCSLHISKSQIIRSFKQSEGCTPYEYFLTLKVETAKIFLRDTKMKVREIAEKLSICDEHYFSAMFRARVGMTPREYRSLGDSK